MYGAIFVFVCLVAFLIAIMFIEEFCKIRSSIETLLIGIEFTLASITFFLLRSNLHGNIEFILLLLGTTFLIIGLLVSIYGFCRK